MLALKIKPVIAKLAKEKQGERNDLLEKSTKCSPINTRLEVAKAAGVSDNTIAKVEKIEEKAAPEIKAALLVEEELAANAKARMEEGKNQYTSPEDICPQPTPQEKNKIDRQNKTNYQLAKMAGVSDKTVQRYKKVLQDAPQEIVAQVDMFTSAFHFVKRYFYSSRRYLTSEKICKRQLRN